jgi:hypothetical protein
MSLEIAKYGVEEGITFSGNALLLLQAMTHRFEEKVLRLTKVVIAVW